MNSLSDDTQALVLLCHNLGQPTALKPLSLSEYAALIQWLGQQQLTPKDLLRAQETLPPRLAAKRLSALLSHTAILQTIVRQWQQQGIWVISHYDEAYPQRLKNRFASAPLLYGIGEAALLAKGGLVLTGSAHPPALTWMRFLAKRAAQQGIMVITTNSRGLDSTALTTALTQGRVAIGVCAHRLIQTAKRYQQALEEQRLVLISATAPETPTAQHTLAQQLMYALADAAIVVGTEAHKGATWHGAVEHLKSAGVPLWVLVGDSVPLGNQQLLAQGALTLEQHQLHPECDLIQLLHSPQPTQPQKPEILAPVDLFTVIWPYLAQQLTVAQTEQQLAMQLQLHPTQLRIWLKRALACGQIKKLTQPVRYIHTAATTQLSLFDK